jgi:hypothetical protein
MLNPETADTLVGMRQCQIAAFRVRKRSAVEIQPEAVLPPPLHPALEMGRLHLIAVNRFSPEIAVYLVQAQAVAAGDKGSRLQYIRPQLVHVASATGIIARYLYAPGKRTAPILETRDIVRLPAMKGQGHLLHFLQRILHIYAYSGITLFRYTESGLNRRLFFHDFIDI